jgi:hypothetical protein
MLCRGRVSRTVERIDVNDIVVALSLNSCRIGRIDDPTAEPNDP